MSRTMPGAALAVLMTLVYPLAHAERAPRAARLSATARQAMTWYGGDMETAIKSGSTPHVTVVNVNGKVTRDRQFGYGTHKAGILDVTGLGASGKLRVVMLLPVSGHVSGQAATYAKTNRYNITLSDDQGTQLFAAPKVASTGYVTPHELDLKLRPGKNILDFWPDGSGGAGGYIEGRRYEITWDGL
jgi:hypothetical protein